MSDEQNPINDPTSVPDDGAAPPPFTVQEDGTVRVPLAYPVQAQGKTLDALIMRRPKGKDLKECDDKSSMAMTAKLVARLAGVPPSTIDGMDGADFTAAASGVAYFLDRSPRTGAS